ncbi:MAG: hypothetical protein RBG13Loki_3805 [Promethearchaeota archaeon CR_4]|nr:MAG: hypothetical protein RBG13Loki_3805 [Candidatus Lokiarchaeota archaeon CR_4]
MAQEGEIVNLGIQINAKIKMRKLRIHINSHLPENDRRNIKTNHIRNMMQEIGLTLKDSQKTLHRLGQNSTNPDYISYAFEDRVENIIIIWKEESLTINFHNQNLSFRTVLESRNTIINALSRIIKNVDDEVISYQNMKFSYKRLYSFSLTNPNTLSSIILTPLSLFAIFIIWYFADPTQLLGPLISFGIGLGFAIFLGIYQYIKFKEEIYSLLPW